MFDIGDHKSLRPDGYNVNFFIQAWDIVRDDFNAAIIEFGGLADSTQIMESYSYLPSAKV